MGGMRSGSKSKVKKEKWGRCRWTEMEESEGGGSES